MGFRQNENQRPLLLNKKRSRQDTIPGGTALPQLGDFNSNSRSASGDVPMRSRTPSHTFNPEIPPSPTPFVNTQYAMRGGLDTLMGFSTAQQAQYFDQNTESEFSDVNYRRTLATGRRTGLGRQAGGGKEGFERDYHTFARLPSLSSQEFNGRPRVASPEVAPSPGWGKLAAGMVGGVVGTVVGKVWQFCKAGAFSGFNAGGGEGYQIDAKHTKEAEIADDYSTTQCEFPDPPPAYTPLSEYQEPVEESLCMVNHPTPNQTASQRPAKRRQISHENRLNNNDAAIEGSWVVVPIPSVPSSPAPAQPSNYSRNPRISHLPARMSLNNSSPARRAQTVFPQPASASRAPARLGAAQRRPLLHTRQSNSVSSTASPARVGFSTRPSTATASYASPTVERPSTASYASPRNSFASSTGGGYQSRIPVPQPRSEASTPTGTPSRSQIPLPNKRDGRTSVASNRGTPTQGVLSPAAIEAQKWRQAKKAADAEEDIAMKRLNKQLQDMIREGQQALGTRFEVRDAEAANEDEEMEDLSGEVLSNVLGRR